MFPPYTFKYFLIEITLPRTPIPIPSIRYTTIIDTSISCNVTRCTFIICMKLAFTICSAIKLYTPPTIAIDIKLDIRPIIIPSTINGQRINPFVAPTYFIIDISFLLACTVSFIVFEIINIDIIISNSKITPVTILIPFAKSNNVDTVSSLLVIFTTFSIFEIWSCISLLFDKSVTVTTYDVFNCSVSKPSNTPFVSF